MSDAEKPRRQVVIPALVLGVAVVAVVLFLVFDKGDSEPKPKATAKATATGPKPATASLKGSGKAPESIAIDKASVARGTAAVGVGVSIPELDVDDLDRITIKITQGSSVWTVATRKDPRDAFVSPRLERTKNGVTREYACAKAGIRAAGTRLSASVPIACLDRTDASLRVSITLRGTKGATETTVRTKPLAAPKS